MPYRHFGSIGDMWKHIPLCEFLVIEKPTRYIETNSASPTYSLPDIPPKQYGIFHLATHVDRFPLLKTSFFWQSISKHPTNQDKITTYLGSPALAMDILGKKADEYVFFDLESECLAAIKAHAEQQGLAECVICRNEDSIEGLMQLIPKLKPGDFLHVDPYLVHQQNAQGHTYFEGFCAAMQRGIPGMLWYGFTTFGERDAVHQGFSQFVSPQGNTSLIGIELSSVLLSAQAPEVNPGILGCGILIGNMGLISEYMFQRMAETVIELYKGSTMFGHYPGDLEMRRFELQV